MRKLGIPTVAMLGLILAVTVSANSAPLDEQNPHIQTLITSSPPGAKVTYTAFGKERDLGKTPLTWSFLASDINRSSTIPTLTFTLPSHTKLRLPLTRSGKVHAKLTKSPKPTTP